MKKQARNPVSSPKNYRSKLRNFDKHSVKNQSNIVSSSETNSEDDLSGSFNYKSPIRLSKASAACLQQKPVVSSGPHHNIHACGQIGGENKTELSSVTNPSNSLNFVQNSTPLPVDFKNTISLTPPAVRKSSNSNNLDISNNYNNLHSSISHRSSVNSSVSSSFKSSNLSNFSKDGKKQKSVLCSPSAFSHCQSASFESSRQTDKRTATPPEPLTWSPDNLTRVDRVPCHLIRQQNKETEKEATHTKAQRENCNYHINQNLTSNSTDSNLLDTSQDTCDLLGDSFDRLDFSAFDTPVRLSQQGGSRLEDSQRTPKSKCRFTPIKINFQSPLKIRRDNFIKRKHHTPLRNCAKIAKRFEDQVSSNLIIKRPQISVKNGFEPITRLKSSRKRTHNEVSTTPLKLDFKKLKI